MEVRGFIQGGELAFRPAVAALWRTWCHAHENSHILITEDKEERSNGQLRLYRAWLEGVCAHSGNDPDTLHSWLIERCAPVVVSTIKGPKGSIEIEQKKRTSGGHRLSMDKLEMHEFLERCAQLTGYPLPTPEQLEELGYLRY